ncbi:hypothetical protein [Sinanaerobacter chloroacetimidivorans]|jgi:hypothetical protein|uniref:Uncharacterized protein n=1 Tax=Sinanaerobacter chloroacetimidivorans TaxID=2818044 RepID=A0A8J7VZP4_9FIRM|nr:hypothetical protein [Sinanaerobacter chloroacetimidivorans]MBR0596938.1 hypothetical protein [Sinanaerobacter chloroacetimidivorans]
MFMSKDSNSTHVSKTSLKQIKVPQDGQLSKKGTVTKDTRTANEIDYSIAEIVEKINHAGFISKFSCSGLKKDHPYNDVKHDGAYISFLRQDNDTEALAFIKKAAISLHMTVEHCIISRRPALVVRIDKDKAGNSLSDRIKMANETMDHIYGYHSKRPYGAYTKDLEAIISRSGGLIYDSDEKIETVWKKFGDLLLKSRYQNAS